MLPVQETISNYVIKWAVDDGSIQRADAFPSFESAEEFSKELSNREFVVSVEILRAGKHPLAKKWAPTNQRVRKTTSPNSKVELVLDEEAWALPAGFVDGDADKHGPAVIVTVIGRNTQPPRSNAEKGNWYEQNEGAIQNWLDRIPMN